MAQVVALVDDLIFQSKLVETAKQAGVELRTCATAETLASEIASSRPKLVIVDLNARANPIEAIARVNADGVRIPLIGFLSHVQTELAERARAAGCGEVMPRSKFTRDLATILQRVKSQS